MEVSLSDLFLAYRQAKTSLFFERRGVGLLDIAHYENDLGKNLRRLKQHLQKHSWFDAITPGQVWIVPKRHRTPKPNPDGVTVIGRKSEVDRSDGLDIQVRMSPAPDFAIVEVLYLWQFGPLLDGLLPKEAVGYRLDLRNGKIRKDARWVFEYWPKRYNQYRGETLGAAQRALNEEKGPIDIISADLASFYDTVDASFLLSEDFLENLSAVATDTLAFEYAEYTKATQSLINAYKRFHRVVGTYTGLPWTIGVPIGALTSRVVANVALATLDSAIRSHADLICYRRYVDDFVIVGRSKRSDLLTIDAMMQHYISASQPKNDRFELDVVALQRIGSQFSLQREKCRGHQLSGQAGRDFLAAVATDFKHLVSERRAFMDPTIFDPEETRRVIKTGKETGRPVRSLRDTDRTKLEHFALSTMLGSLERISMLVDKAGARELVGSVLGGLERMISDRDSWVECIESAFRLLGIVCGIEDWKTAREIVVRMDSLWGDLASLNKSIGTLFYRNTPVKGASAWVWLRNYLHESRLEAICSSLSEGEDAGKMFDGRFAGLRYRTQFVSINGLMGRAHDLAAADLRAFDREDDFRLRGISSAKVDQLRDGLRFSGGLANRLRIIDSFRERVAELGDPAWNINAERLFLSTRPPSYFDIARRWLYKVESTGFRQGIFEELLTVVNAVRGTGYIDPVGSVVTEEPSRVTVPTSDPRGVAALFAPIDPRLILGNLVVSEDAFNAAAKKNPDQSVERMKGLVTVLARAASVARKPTDGRSCLLVLPELSLPRLWFREVANYVVRHGPYGLVTGLEYLHHSTKPHVFSQVYAVLPGPFGSVASWPWTKRRPAVHEAELLAQLKLSFLPMVGPEPRRAVVDSPYGLLSVLVCSELLEVRLVADLSHRVELVIVPSWNTDTSSYDHLIQSVGLQLHSMIAVANNGTYSDCRTWAPLAKRWARDLCRLIERGVDDVVYVDLPLQSLRAFHASGQGLEWKPLPPDWDTDSGPST